MTNDEKNIMVADEILKRPTTEWSLEDATIVQSVFDKLLEESRAHTKRCKEIAEGVRDGKFKNGAAAAALNELIAVDDAATKKRRTYLMALSQYLGLLD